VTKTEWRRLKVCCERSTMTGSLETNVQANTNASIVRARFDRRASEIAIGFDARG
jgi:hypothetical protein